MRRARGDGGGKASGRRPAVGPQRRVQRATRIDPRQALGLRSPCSVSRARGRDDGGPLRVGRLHASSLTATPAISRMASANGTPPAAATFSTRWNRSSSCESFRRSTSTSGHAGTEGPSEPASSERISAVVRRSSPRASSTRKSSSAAWPSADGARPPIVALTFGRAGRPEAQPPGVRTTMPASSSAGTSSRNCRASAGVQRKGW